MTRSSSRSHPPLATRWSLLPSCQLGIKTSWLPWVEQGTVLYPMNWSPSAHQPGLQGWSKTEPSPSTVSDHGWTTIPSQSPAWTKELENAPWTLFYLWDVFQNWTSCRAKSDKMEPGTWPGLFFGFTTPKSNSQDTTNPIGCLTSWAAAGLMLLRSTFGFIVCSSVVQLSLSWPFRSQIGPTCAQFCYIYLLHLHFLSTLHYHCLFPCLAASKINLSK